MKRAFIISIAFAILGLIPYLSSAQCTTGFVQNGTDCDVYFKIYYDSPVPTNNTGWIQAAQGNTVNFSSLNYSPNCNSIDHVDVTHDPINGSVVSINAGTTSSGSTFCIDSCPNSGPTPCGSGYSSVTWGSSLDINIDP